MKVDGHDERRLIVSPAIWKLLAQRADAAELELMQAGDVQPMPILGQRKMLPRTTGEALGEGFNARMVASGDVILEDGEVWGHWRPRR